MMRNGVGDTPQEKAGQPLASMGGHDHQIHIFRLLFNHGGRITLDDLRGHFMLSVHKFAGGQLHEFLRVLLYILPLGADFRCSIGLIDPDRDDGVDHAQFDGIGEWMLREPSDGSVSVVSILNGNEHLLNLACSTSDDQGRAEPCKSSR